MEVEPRVKKKSFEKATELVTRGQVLLMDDKYFDAKLKFNEALCYAESPLQLALAYGNRSAVYLKLKLYSQCLHNVQLARDKNYPAKVISNLDKVETRCKTKMMREKPQSPFEKPTFSAMTISSYEYGDESNKYKYCYYCLNDNLLDLIQCSSCNSAMFCNKICQTKAHQIHQYNCVFVESSSNTSLS